MATTLDSTALHDQGLSQEGWQAAVDVLSSFKPMIAPFQGAIRVMRSRLLPDDAKVVALKHLFRFTVYRDVVKQFCLSTCPDQDFEVRGFSPAEVLKRFGFDECAALLALFCSYRRMRQGITASQAQAVADHIHGRAECGFLLGRVLPEVGASHGLLIGGMRFVAIGAMGSANPDLFERYLNHLKAKRATFDLDYEITKWGCSHPQVGSLLLQQLGFGHTLATALFIALMPLAIDPAREPLAHRLRALSLWIESLHAKQYPAYRKEQHGFGLSEDEFRELARTIVARTRSDSARYWLD